MAAKLLVLYGTPTDPAAFDRHYADVHTPLAKKIATLRSFETSRGQVVTPAGPAPYHLVVSLTFDSMADLQAALGSPEGQATAGDLQSFASGGATLLMFETEDL